MSLSPGNYNVIENDLGYTVTYDGVCNNPSHTITLNSGDPPQTCTINNSHCLIATAAFGSELAPQVQFLRDFRDNHLLKTSVGSEFITVFNQWYYSFSPNVADYERQNPLLRDLVKTSIYPLLGILTVSEKGFTLFNGNFGTMAAGLMAVSMMGAVYISPLTLSIKGIRNGNLNLKITAIIVLGALVSVLIALASSNPTTIELTSLIFLLSIMALTSLATAKTFVRIVKKILKIKIKNF